MRPLRPLRIDSLFGDARRDIPPRVDVTDDVMARIRRARSAAALHPYRPLVWMLTGSSAVAAAVAVAAVLSYRTVVDPVNLISDMISWAV